tara:strand:+ start:129 stop:578 length:450 start_codon:yes stop_codon:yes gene_type:complete
MIKTFRGILIDGGQQQIRLSTKKGKIGYKILKFQFMPHAPGTTDTENVTQLFKVKQTSVPTTAPTIDFSDGNLLGAIWSLNDASGQQGETTIIFDREIFNQDVFVTYTDVRGSSTKGNYYLEVETMVLTDNAAAVSTLRDIRLNPQIGA